MSHPVAVVRRLACGISMLAGALTACIATVRHVPEDYATIQDALNAISDGDTVLVEVGIYAEALLAPPLSFTLRGNVAADTGDYPRPTVDPSSLPNPGQLTCLILPQGSHPVIEDLRFRNGPEMYPRPASVFGGIWSHTEDPVVRNCVFDSVYVGLAADDPGLVCSPVVEHCLFRDDSGACIALGPGQLTATDCLFTGSGFSLVQCHQGSLINRCRFQNGHGNNWLWELLLGWDIEVRDCVFGPFGPYPIPVVELVGSGWVEGCLFVENRCFAALSLQRNCHDTVAFEPFVVRDNVFLHNGPAGSHDGFGGIHAGCDTSILATAAIIENNVFEECSSYVWPKACLLSSGGTFRNNRLTRLTPPQYPDLLVLDAPEATIRENLIWETSYALRNGDGYDRLVDARWNWWGDSTGPRAATNPSGLGDSVGINVLFDPWYPDTSFLSTSDSPSILPPSSFILSAYPNPFNSVVQFTLIPSQVGIVKVELFDILGRRTSEIWKGPLAFQKDIAFDALSLASGIYFARVTDVISRTNLATAKLVLLK